MAPIKTLRRIAVTWAIAVMAAPVWNGAWAAQPTVLTPPGNDATFPREFFGIHVHLNPPERWPTLPFGAIRLWDSRVSWPQLEPAKGQWNFAVLDRYVDWAQSRSMDVLLPLGLSPTWASARPQETSAYGSAPGRGAGYAAEPAQIDDWRDYVHTVATRYKGRIHHYELWNEVTAKEFFSGQPADLVRLAAVAKRELVAVDPANRLVAPSAVSLGPVQTAWPARFMSEGGADAADIASFHLYHGGHPPELKLGMAPNIRAQLVRSGFGGKPLWNTETGYFLPAPPGAKPATDSRYIISEQTAAEYVPRDLLLSRAMGFERFYWFAWDNDFLGLLVPGTSALRPHAKVLGQFMSLLTDAHLKQCARDNAGLWRCDLVLAGGNPALAVWADPSATGSPHLTPPFVGKLVRLDGADAGTRAGNDIVAGPVVQLLVKE